MQSILTSTEQNQTLQIIQGEIRLAERDKEKIHESLKQLQEIRAIENKEYESTRKQRQKDISTLTEKRNTLEQEVKNAEEKKAQIFKNIEAYGADELKNVKLAVTSIYAEAQQVKTEADNKLSDVNQRDGLVTIREHNVNQKENELLVKEAAVAARERAIKQQENELLLKVDRVNALMKKVGKQRDAVEREIIIKTAIIKGLDTTISEKQAYAKKLETEAEVKLKEARRALVQTKLVKIMQDQKEEKFRIKEIQLKDRQRTLQRGFDELRSKGGTVNG